MLASWGNPWSFKLNALRCYKEIDLAKRLYICTGIILIFNRYLYKLKQYVRMLHFNSLTFNNSTLCPHCIYVFVFIWEQTATCATYSINWLVFITEMKSVYSAVRTGSLNKSVCALFNIQQLYVLPTLYLCVCIYHTYRCDDTRGCVMQFWPPDDEHMCSKHVEAWNKLMPLVSSHL